MAQNSKSQHWLLHLQCQSSFSIAGVRSNQCPLQPAAGLYDSVAIVQTLIAVARPESDIVCPCSDYHGMACKAYLFDRQASAVSFGNTRRGVSCT